MTTNLAIPPRPIVADRPAWRWLRYGAATLAAALAAVYYFRHDPAQPGGFFPPCLFHVLTHLYCPGCGSQRAAHQLLHGRLLGALHCNALACAAVPLLAWEAIAKTTRRLPSLLYRRRIGWTVVWLVIIFSILRNIPVWPCTLLSPGS
ncbi:MAG: DUF2752 domain-containing protein [Tepidisphaerales bacterium]